MIQKTGKYRAERRQVFYHLHCGIYKVICAINGDV